jgi:hypothetical protein
MIFRYLVRTVLFWLATRLLGRFGAILRRLPRRFR